MSDHVFAHYEIASGDLDAGFAEAEIVLEGTYSVGHQEQLYIENNAMIAVPEEHGGLTVYGSLQCPYYIHKAMKRALALDDIQTRVVQAETGGGFGGKEEYPSIIAIHAALLARACRKPVRMIYDRHEDISATTKRHPAVVTHRTGMRRDGTLVAQDIEVVMDGGAYCTLSPVVLSRGALHAGGPYRCPNVRIRSRVTRTNTPPNGAFRGFGAPQTEFAAETHLNRLAEAVGLSPLEIRRRNVYVLGDTTPTGQVLRHSVAGEEVLERAAEAAEFERMRERTTEARSAPSGAPYRTGLARRAPGVGIALAWHGAGFTGSGEVKLASVAAIELTGDGRIEILTGSTEMGQGTKTIFPQLVADALGVEYDDVDIAPQDTAFVPDSGPTVASRTAMVVGGLLITAVAPAARDGRSGDRPVVRRELSRLRCGERTAARRPAVRAISRRVIRRRDLPRRRLPGLRLGVVRGARRGGPRHGRGSVLDVVAADDVGKVIHPVLAEGQVEGGTLQAVGYATIEEMKVRDGRYVNDRLATYLIPTALDAPRITLDPRRGAVPRRPAHGEGRRRAADGCRCAGGRRRDPRRDRRVDPRPAATPEKILAALHPSGARDERSRDSHGDREAAIEAPIEGGPDPRPEARPTRSRLASSRTATSRPARNPRIARGTGSAMSAVRFLVNGEPTEIDVPGHAPPARRPARGPRADRHERGLRGRGVRGVHGPARRGRRRFVPCAHLPGRRFDRPDRRRPCPPALDPGGTPELDELQTAFLELGGAQCGICTPGMLMAARAYLDDGGGRDEAAIREAIAGNLCRCTGYTKIIDSIAAAAHGPEGPAA